MSIKQNTADILKRVKNAAEKSGRKLEDINIIAVTKTVDVNKALEVVECGITNLGENRVQEFNNKYEKMLNNNIKWHMIGHLQRNKVKYIIDKVEMIHSVESIKLAEEINKKAGQKNIVAKILIEINIGGEESKFGINPNNSKSFINELREFKNIEICGIMTIAPYFDEYENTRIYFKKMKKIFDELSAINQENSQMKYLSMGMTNDYEIAIEEGSNIVRIGTGFFGQRKY